jgi:SurA-like N-terminal domain
VSHRPDRVALAVLVVVLAACGSDGGGPSTTATTSGAAGKRSAPLDPRRVVAVVGDQPVSRAEYDHFYAAARAGNRDLPASQARRDTMGYLIRFLWVRGEARARGVTITRAELDAQYDRIRRRTFPKRSQYRAFLRRGTLTVRDVRDQVRMTMLSARLVRAATGAIKDERARRLANARYASELTARWRARTRCAPGFHTPECGRP